MGGKNALVGSHFLFEMVILGSDCLYFFILFFLKFSNTMLQDVILFRKLMQFFSGFIMLITLVFECIFCLIFGNFVLFEITIVLDFCFFEFGLK